MMTIAEFYKRVCDLAGDRACCVQIEVANRIEGPHVSYSAWIQGRGWTDTSPSAEHCVQALMTAPGEIPELGDVK